MLPLDVSYVARTRSRLFLEPLDARCLATPKTPFRQTQAMHPTFSSYYLPPALTVPPRALNHAPVSPMA